VGLSLAVLGLDLRDGPMIDLSPLLWAFGSRAYGDGSGLGSHEVVQDFLLFGHFKAPFVSLKNIFQCKIFSDVNDFRTNNFFSGVLRCLVRRKKKKKKKSITISSGHHNSTENNHILHLQPPTQQKSTTKSTKTPTTSHHKPTKPTTKSTKIYHHKPTTHHN
jgi:hypothetical protein